MTEERLFSPADSTRWTEVAPGARRRVLISTAELMLVEFSFEAGVVGAPHSHPHVQASYVAEGQFEVTIDARTDVIGAGGSFIVPANRIHGVRALAPGRLVDSFTPRRDDFL